MKDNLVLTDAFLTDTAKRFDDVYLASLPTPEAHEYPADFYKKLAAVSEKRKKRRTLARRIAAIFLAVLIGGALFLAVNPDARAMVKGWVVSLGRTAVVYRVANGAERSDLPKYELSCLPEGYEEVCRLPKLTGRTLIYAPPEGDHVVILSYYLRFENREIRIEYDKREAPEKVKIRALSGDYYPNSMARVILGIQHDFLLRDYSGAKAIRQANTLVWFDESEEMIFILVSDLEKDSMVRMAKDVVPEDPAK